LSLDERARLGLGIAFQRPPTIRGLTLRNTVLAFSRSSKNGRFVEEMAARVNLQQLLDRQVNHGFSGGELKRSELLQLLVQQPRFVMFDEPESGVDLDSIALVGQVINELLGENNGQAREKAGLIITHTGHILNYVRADRGHVLLDGTIGCSGDSLEMLENIRAGGYQNCVKCTRRPR
ncbi:MAG: ATP-binding cassette domain-containing protein, partial [Chloroflexota bacterium]